MCGLPCFASWADALASGSATTVFLSPPADFKQVKFHIFIFAGVAELADALASGSATTVFLSPPADSKQVKFHIFIFAGVAELADALASGGATTVTHRRLGRFDEDKVSNHHICRCGGIGRRASFG